jgi:hypothetical protein
MRKSEYVAVGDTFVKWCFAFLVYLTMRLHKKAGFFVRGPQPRSVPTKRYKSSSPAAKQFPFFANKFAIVF